MTSHNLKNPAVVAIPNPIDLDLAIQQCQNTIAAVPWLEKVFARARNIPRKNPQGTTERLPHIYQSNGEYYPAVPNDALKAFAFFMLSGSRNIPDHAPRISPIYASAPVSLIVWGNLNRIDNATSKDYYFTELLINNVCSQLTKNTNAQITRVHDEHVRDIWPGYVFDESTLGLLMWPYFSFRVEFTLNYSMICPAPVVPVPVP